MSVFESENSSKTRSKRSLTVAALMGSDDLRTDIGLVIGSGIIMIVGLLALLLEWAARPMTN